MARPMSSLSCFPAVLLSVFFLIFAVPAAASDNNPVISQSVTQGGLTCFTITPAEDKKHGNERPSCDGLCGQQGAACTGVTNGAMNPPTKAEDPPVPYFAICRCCKVGGL